MRTEFILLRVLYSIISEHSFQCLAPVHWICPQITSAHGTSHDLFLFAVLAEPVITFGTYIDFLVLGTQEAYRTLRLFIVVRLSFFIQYID